MVYKILIRQSLIPWNKKKVFTIKLPMVQLSIFQADSYGIKECKNTTIFYKLTEDILHSVHMTCLTVVGAIRSMEVLSTSLKA
jgi:hypothetical protein